MKGSPSFLEYKYSSDILEIDSFLVSLVNTLDNPLCKLINTDLIRKTPILLGVKVVNGFGPRVSNFLPEIRRILNLEVRNHPIIVLLL